MMKKVEGQNMPCWYYEKADLKKTPSFHDGINAETEARYRREGPRYIFNMGTLLGLHHDTIATGVVFYHRFYMFHSFKKFPRHVTATCCLFLAGKVEETPKKCKDLIKVAKGLLNEAQFAQFGDDPKEEVLTFEKVLLQTIKFDLTVEHPYKYMVQYAKGLKGERSKIEKLVQMAWTFINDSLCTSLCLQWEPQIIAVAVMFLAGRLCKFEPQDWAYNRGRWWEQFIDDISVELLEDICHQFLTHPDDLFRVEWQAVSADEYLTHFTFKSAVEVLDQYSPKGNKPTANKAKRERPKTPGDGEKSLEPQAKSSRSDSQKQKPKIPQPQSAQKGHSSRTSAAAAPLSKTQSLVSNQRRGSSNTEVVAMDTVDTTDRGTIEQGKPPVAKPATNQPTSSGSTSNTATPTKPATGELPSNLYNINQYQSFIGSSDPKSLGIFQAGGYGQFGSAFPGMQIQNPPVRQSFSNKNATQTNFPAFPTMPGSFENAFPHFPRTPEGAQNNFPSNFSGQSSTSLATVRITGRREQQPNTKWS